MAIRGGYADKILRVDLTRGAITTEPLPPEEVLRKYVGGTGLGLYYLLKEAPANVKATDPEAPFILMTGPGLKICSPIWLAIIRPPAGRCSSLEAPRAVLRSWLVLRPWPLCQMGYPIWCSFMMVRVPFLRANYAAG